MIQDQASEDQLRQTRICGCLHPKFCGLFHWSFHDNGRFYTETNITSWRKSRLQNYYQCKNGKTSKIILKTEVFLFVNVKPEDEWNLSLRQQRANLEETKESNGRILANIMLIFVRFFICSRRRTLVS